MAYTFKMPQSMQSAVFDTLPIMPDVLCDLIAQYSQDTIRKVFSKRLVPSYELNDQRYELQNGSIYNTTTSTVAYLDGKIDVFNIAKVHNITYFIINTGYENNKYLILLNKDFKVYVKHWSYNVSDLYVVNNIIFTGNSSSIEKYILQVDIDKHTGMQTAILKCKGGVLNPYNMHAVKTVYQNTVVTYNYAENRLEFYQSSFYRKIECINISTFKIPPLTWEQAHYAQGKTSCVAAEDIAGNLLVYINNYLLTIAQTASVVETANADQSTHAVETPHANIATGKKIKYHVIQVLKK